MLFNRKYRKSKEGFTLIEVNMALLIIAIGLLSIFSLFPEGLRLSAHARDDTRQSFFADMIFGMIQGNADNIQDFSNWVEKSPLIAGTGIIAVSPNRIYYYDILEGKSILAAPSNAQVLANPTRYMAFTIRIDTPNDSPRMFDIELFCTQNFSNTSKALEKESGFYTAVFFKGDQ